MNRIKVTNEYGEITGWFDKNKSTKFEGKSYCNDINTMEYYSNNLYYANSGEWILANESEVKESTYEYIDNTEVVQWFIDAEYSDSNIADLPESVRKRVMDAIVNQEHKPSV